LPKDYQDLNSAGNEEIERKIIYNAFITLAVEYTDSTGSDIKKIAQKYEGYVQEEGTYRAIIRVKANLLEQAIADVGLLGKMKEKRLSGTDVTDDYLDYEIRLDNALKARQRYLALLEQAENVESALKVEKELERLNEVIELIKGKMNRIDHLSQFATINITLQEYKKPGVLGYVGLGFYHAVKWLFVRN
jgi:hypothetical protein